MLVRVLGRRINFLILIFTFSCVLLFKTTNYSEYDINEFQEPAYTVHEVYACEEDIVTLSCNDSFIEITTVMYGKQPTPLTNNCVPPYNHSYDCQEGFQNNCTATFSFTCNGKSSCQFQAISRTFGVDPCRNQKKAAYFKFKCVGRKQPYHPVLTESVAIMMVESARRPAISQAAESALKYLNTSWPLYIWYPPPSKDPTYLDMLTQMPYVDIAKKQNRTVHYLQFEEQFYGQSQNIIAYSKKFWSTMKEDKLFFLHSDSSYCHPSESFPYRIEDFLYFDFVGAPWSGPRDFLDRLLFVGNGGFSIRNRELMIKCIEYAEEHKYVGLAEDYFFSLCISKFGKFAGWELARYFAVETMYPPEDGSMGIHGICSWGKSLGCNQEWVSKWLSL